MVTRNITQMTGAIGILILKFFGLLIMLKIPKTIAAVIKTEKETTNNMKDVLRKIIGTARI